MKSTRHIWRLAAALLMLGIFMTIHIAKTFHTHPPASTLSKITGISEKVEVSADCAVCDYHFTKDGHYEPATTTLLTGYHYTPAFLSFKSHIASSIGLHYSDRGPPALA